MSFLIINKLNFKSMRGSLWNELKKCIEHFDWEKVHKAMVATNHKVVTDSGILKVPNKNEMVEIVLNLALSHIRLISQHKKEDWGNVSTSSAGFEVFYTDGEGWGISYVVTQMTSDMADCECDDCDEGKSLFVVSIPAMENYLLAVKNML